MKFLFNFFLIFYIIYQVVAENETNVIEEILNNITDDNNYIIYLENYTFNYLREKYENVKENLTNLDIKTVLLNLDELPENSTLEKFSNDLLNELKNKKNWFNENDSLIYSLFLSNNSGIIIVNYPNITNDTLEEMLNETKNDKPEDRISKVMNNLLDKIVPNPELDDSSESNDNSTSQIKDDSTSESNDNSTSQIKDDSTSESNDNSTSQIKDDSTSESQDNSTSQIKDDSTSESQDNSTSQIKDDSTSESQDESKSQSKDESKSQSKDESKSQSKDESESQSKEESKSQSKDDSESQSKEDSEIDDSDSDDSDSGNKHKKDDSSDDDGLSAGKIVLIVLSCVAGLIIIVIVVACLCKRNKQDAYNAVNQTSFKDNKLLDED